MKTRSTVAEHSKCISELSEGILTQCVKWDTLYKIENNPLKNAMTATNILLKINAKLGGINHIVQECATQQFKNIMFVGADVTHASPGSTNPSIATVSTLRRFTTCRSLFLNLLLSRCIEFCQCHTGCWQLQWFRLPVQIVPHGSRGTL